MTTSAWLAAPVAAGDTSATVGRVWPGHRHDDRAALSALRVGLGRDAWWSLQRRVRAYRGAGALYWLDGEVVEATRMGAGSGVGSTAQPVPSYNPTRTAGWPYESWLLVRDAGAVGHAAGTALVPLTGRPLSRA